MKRKLLFITLLMLFCSAVFGQQHWTMNNQGDYTIPMSVYANVSINGVPIKGANYEMAAFHGEELRGVAIPEYDSLLEQYIVTLTVYGKNNGDEISFKLFDPTIGDDGEELETDFKVGFRNDPVGQPIFPQSIDFYEPYFDFDAPSSVENYMGFGCAVKIDGVEQNRPNLEIAAFKENGEVCGYARSQALVGTNIYIFSLQIYAQNGETISFKLFDPTIGEDGDVLSTDYTIKCNVNYDSEGEIVYIDFKNNAVAQITNTTGTHYFASLAAAVNAAGQNETTIVMIADAEVSETVKVVAGQKITLDLNGKTIDGTEKVRIALMSYGDLTIKDSTEEKNGMIKAGIGTAGNTVNICKGTFTLESGNIYSKNNAILIDEETATVNINGGTITAEPTTDNSAAFYISSTSDTEVNIKAGTMKGFNGILLWNNTKINITGGSVIAEGDLAIQGNGSRDNTEINISGENTIITGKDAAIYHPQGGKLNISGGTITGSTGIVVKGGEVTISGGTINGTGEAVAYAPVSSGYQGTGDALYVEHYDNSQNSENYGTPTVTVTGGTFNSTNAQAVASYANPNNDVEAIAKFISGGTFDNPIAEAYCAEGYIPADLGNGKYGVKQGTFVARVNGVGYETVTAAIAAAQAGETVQLLSGEISEYIAPWANDIQHTSEKSITILGSENFGTTLTGGLYLGYDDSQCRDHNIVVKGINFTGKGILVAGQKNVVIENNKFSNITDCVADPGSANANAISVIGKNINATVTGNVIDGTASAGINLRDTKTVNVSGNTVTNTVHNSITIQNNTTDTGDNVVIENNTLSNWGTGGEGRAVRTAGGATVNVNGNVMTKENAPEEFVKVTGSTTLDASANYWNGNSPLSGNYFLSDLAADPVSILKSYYTDAAKSNLVQLSASVAKIGTTYYQTINAAIAAAQADDEIELLKDIEATEVILINKSLTISGNGHKVTSSANRVFRVTVGDTEVTLNDVDMVSTAVRVGTNDVRGISIDIIDNVTLTLNNCSVDFTDASANDWAYAVNVTGGNKHNVTVNGGIYEGANVINVNGHNHTIVVENATLNCTYPNNDMYYGACIWVLQNQSSSVVATGNTFNGGNAVAFNIGTGTGLTESNNTDNTECLVAKVGETYYSSLAEAFAAAQDGATIKVLHNIALSEGVTVAAGKTVVLDLNGKKISRDTEAATSSAAITNNGNLTIKDEVGGGKVTAFAANPDTQAIPYYASNTITNSGVLTVLSGTIENSTGDEARAAFPIDNNSTSRDAIVNIEGGTITGRGAIRQFANSNTNKNEVNVTAGTVTGTSYAIWVQNPGSGDPKASFNIEGGELSKILMDPNANFEGSITGGTITEVAIWEADTTNPDRNPSGFIKGGTFSTDVTEFCAEGFTAKPNANDTYDVRFADYIFLPTGMDESNYEKLFGTNTVTDGTNYYATLQKAVEAVVGKPDAILYCKPGADVGSLQHAPVTSTLTVYGNDAYVSGGAERDFDLGNTDPTGGSGIISDMTLTVKYLDGCGAWGAKATEHTVNLVFENCYNMGKVFVTGTTGTLNITMNNCAFEGVISEALYSNADGTIALTNVAFSNLNKAVNLNHKAAGTQTVTMTGCTFTNCGNDVAEDQIPVRVLSSVEGGSSVLTVNACTFTGTPEGGADILLDYGIGLTTATVSYTAAYVVVEREDNVQTDNDKTTTLADQIYTFDNRPYVAKVGDVSYKTIAEALAAVPDGGTITLINNVTEEFAINNTTADITLDMAGFTLTGAITPSKANLTIKNGTINNENASYSAIEINEGSLVLNDVRVTSKRHGVRIDGPVEATINGGEYRLSATSGTRHAVNVSGAANVTIKAGTFVGPKGTTMDSGSAVCVQSGATVTIEGGDFSGGKNVTISSDGNLTITGGTFDQDVTAYCAEGYVCQMNADNKYEVFFAVAQIGETYYETIQEAVDAAVAVNNAIQLLANIDGDVTILQQEGINIVIDGKKNETENYTFNGTINIYGNARNTGTETLKIQNVNFYTEDSGRYFIEANETGQISGTNNFKQYAHNVTVENCNFATSAGNTNNTVVGMRFRQAYNISAVNCTSDGIFSIMWTTAVDGLTLTDVVATNCKEGITIGGASKKVNITNTQIESNTYAIRAEGAGSDFTIENSTLVAKVPVVVREVTDNSMLSFTFKGTNTITESNPTSYWFVAGAGAAYQGNENEQLPVIKGQVTVVLNNTGLSYDGVYGNYGVAKIGDVVYTTFNDAYNAATANQTITLLDDITLTEPMTIEKAITLDLGTNTVTGADGAIVFNVKAATTIKNGTVIGNKSGTLSGLIDIYANLDLDGVTIETSKINALRFKAGECTATLTNCNVTGAFKGYGGSVWEIKSGTYKAASTSINDQLNGTASISGGTFYYEIAEEECAPGYVVKNNGDGTWTVEYAPAAFVDANKNGILDEGEVVYGNLDQIFANHKEGDVHVVLTADIVANTQVDTDADAHYYFTTNVAEGVTMDFLFADDWNYIQKMTLGQNITLNANYLLAWTEFNVSGTINTDYLYTTGAKTTITETGVVNANTGDNKTVQVKNGAEFTVNGTLNTSILNVWVGESKLVVSGANAKVDASWVDIWDGTPSVTVQNGATLATLEDNGGIKASRGGSITVDNATLTGKIQLGHNESAGELTVTGNSTLSPITLTVVGSTVSGPENLTVTSGVNGYGVNYFNGVYSLVEIEIQETELFKGWNWFSAYVDINGEEGLTKVQNALAGNATLMKSHTAYGTYYNGDWYNNGGEGLSSASVTEMYMIQMETAMTGENKMKLEGNLVNPSEHTIQLNQNWNWIGYPSNEPINLENAFKGFTPQNGDRIKSHVGFSQYYGEGSNDFGITGWWGTLNAMTPGLGYMYYRAVEGTASFTYNVPADGAKSELRANITADDNYWVPATHRYANNMTMVAMLEGANADNYEVAAFVDGEVRGSARPVYVEPLDAYMFFLTIYGDEVEEMSFRCYDLATGEEYAINDRINYSVDAMLGSIEEPYMFRGTVGIGEATLSEINIYPNPTTTGREISFDATCETVEVFNTLGVKVAEYHYVDTIDAFETAGIYMIRITNNGNVQNCRVVVK